jgi:trimethylamine--corrinoid protein Co-methyltransferase
MSEVRPQIRVLTQEQKQTVHEHALKILSTVGVRVDSEDARKLFTGAGATSDGRPVVRIPPEIVQSALKSAPSTIAVYDRLGNPAFELGNPQDLHTRFGIGVTNLYYQDPETDAVLPFTRKHMEISTCLGQALEGFDVISTIGIVQDLPAQLSDLYGTLEMIANTVKPLVVLVSEENCFDAVLDLLEHLHGDLSERPFIMPYVNPITPLVLNQGTTAKMVSAIKRGLPLIYNNYGMSGATAPITPAGTLALLTAELLAGLVFSQLVKQGAPIILGSLPAGFDMQNMSGLYTPRTMLLNLACAEMVTHFGLPYSGTSGSGPGWGADLSAGGMLWLNHLTSCLGKVGLAPFVGGNFDSLVFSPAMVVYAEEVINQSRLFEQGFTLDEPSVGLDEIEAVGPGGNFLETDLTFSLCRKLHYSSRIWPNLVLDKWRVKGCPSADYLLRTRTRQLLGELGAPEDHAEMIAKGEAFIRQTST